MRQTDNPDVFRVKVTQKDRMTGKTTVYFVGPYASAATARGQVTALKKSYDAWAARLGSECRLEKVFTVQKSIDWEDI